MKKILFDATKNCWVLEGTQMEVEVILASKCSTIDFHPNAYRLPPPIYTVRMRYPRIIHAEIMTHRVFGRNARSSRAVPIKKMLQEIGSNPFVPWHWGRNRKGMQASEECDELVLVDWDFEIGHEDYQTREEAWKTASQDAIRIASGFNDAGYHKQVVNRLLEPFMHIDVLITATEWENFLWLRDHEDAEPHLQDLARMTRQALAEAEFQSLAPGYWHLPYIKPEEYRQNLWDNFEEQVDFLKKISAARCARISYAPFDGDPSYERELERYNLLVTSERVHASPLEHQAAPDRSVIISSDIFYEKEGDLTPDRTLDAREGWENEHLHGNLTGWIQARKLVPNEAHHELA